MRHFHTRLKKNFSVVIVEDVLTEEVGRWSAARRVRYHGALLPLPPPALF